MHISDLHRFIQSDPEFSLKFVAENGELIVVDRCACTSFHSQGHTLNIKLIPSGRIRKVVRITILEINGKELYI